MEWASISARDAVFLTGAMRRGADDIRVQIELSKR